MNYTIEIWENSKKKKLVGFFWGGIYEEKAKMYHKVQEYFPSDGYNKDTFVRRVDIPCTKCSLENQSDLPIKENTNPKCSIR